MSFKTIRHAFEMQAARGNLRDEHVPLMEHITIAEMGIKAFGKAYFGDVWAKAQADVENRRIASETANDVDRHIVKWERLAQDVMSLPTSLARETIVTTLDIPSTLGRARDLTIREAEQPAGLESALMTGSTKVTRNNFLKSGTIMKEYDLLGLFPQPENTNVRYEKFATSEAEYSVAKYSRAIGWTYEAKINDDLGSFLDQAAALGYSARLNRLRVIFEAIIDALTRTNPSGVQPGSGGTAAPGGPTIANIEWAIATLASSNPGRRLGAIGIPVLWEALAKAARDNQYVPNSSPAVINPAYQGFAINVEELLASAMEAAPVAKGAKATDWLAYDAQVGAWLDFATLTGYEASPRIVFKLPDVRDATDLGSFDNMTDAMKVVDVVGAKVTDTTRVLWAAGE